jgi:5-formyltetrahydrofolate cyclo-ligase
MLDHPMEPVIRPTEGRTGWRVTTSEAGDESEMQHRMSDAPASLSKAELRGAALAKRDALTSERCAAAAQAIAERGLPIEISPGAVVAGHSPIRSEIDPTPLLQKLASQGARLALPCITARGQSLKFRLWHPGERLLPGPLGILEPSPAAAEITPDIVLVPLAAFDRAGHRIGYGAGHYDRTLAQLRKLRAVTAIGLAFAAQEVEAVPALQHDVALDYVLTETHMFDFRSS